MHYKLNFSGLSSLDSGIAVPAVRLENYNLDIPPVLQGSVLQFLSQMYPQLRTMALDLMIKEHAKLFPYENGPEAVEQLEILLGPACGLQADNRPSTKDLHLVGDAMRLEIILKAPAMQQVSREPVEIATTAIKAMMVSSYKRLQSLETSLAEHFFQVFMQSTQPAQIPLDVLQHFVVDGYRPTPDESRAIMLENASFWRSELQSLGGAYLQSGNSDPSLLVLLNSSLYSQIKNYFSTNTSNGDNDA